MTQETNTISNLDNISSMAYNDLMPVDDQNDLDIFGAPVTKNYTALQISNYVYRSLGAANFVNICDLAQVTNLTATYSNGTAGVGATLTNSSTQAALSVDGTTVVVGYRILVGGQTTKFQNGIYVVTTVGTASTNWVLTRATDYDTAGEVLIGSFTSLQRGTTFIGKSFVQYNAVTTIGTDSILFSLLSAAITTSAASLVVAGTGATVITGSGGSILTVPAGTKTLIASGDNVTFGTISSNSVTFNTGTGLKTAQSAGNTAFLSAYDVDGAADKVFGTLTANNTPTLAFTQPSDGTLSWDGGFIGATTPPAAILAGITSGVAPASGVIGQTLQANLGSGTPVTVNTAVNTDIISIAYTAGNWMVHASVRWTYSTITNTVTLFFVGTATGDNQTGATAYNTQHIEHPTAGGSGTAGGVVSFPFNTNASGTLYLKINATFSVGSSTAYGAISMVRTS